MRPFVPALGGGLLLLLFIPWEANPGQEPRQRVQSYLDEPELDPDEHDLYLDEYEPVSMLRVPAHEVRGPRLSVVDVRPVLAEELGGKEALLERLEAVGVRRTALLLPTESLQGGENGGGALHHGPLKDRVLLFLNVDLEGIGKPDFGTRLKRLVQETASQGFAGVRVSNNLGLFLRDSGGNRVAVDDERLDPLWRACGEAGLPVLIHTAAPSAFFEPVDRHNELYELFRRDPSLSLYGGGVPPKKELLEERDRAIRRHPETAFIGAHFGEEAEDLTSLTRRLESMPNFLLELSERIGELGRQPYASRRFFLEHADRILFGAGAGLEPYLTYYRFLETDSEYFEFNSDRRLPYGRWRLYGIHLPDEVLEAVYHENAQRVFAARP